MADNAVMSERQQWAFGRWLHDHIARCDAAAAAEEAASEQRRRDREDEAGMRLMMARASGEPIPGVQDVLAVEFGRVEDDSGFDPTQPVGSVANPARFIGDTWVNAPKPEPRRPGPFDALARAAAAGPDEFMVRQLEAYERRRAARRAAEAVR